MKANEPLTKGLRYLLLAYFLLPVLFFTFHFKPAFNLSFSEIYHALENSFLQSVTAASWSMILGSLMALGLFKLRPSLQKVAKYLLLLPQILPVFFTALILFYVVKPFPLGFAGIVLLMTVMNVGLAAVLIYQATVRQLGMYSQVAEMFGLSRLVFLVRIWLPVVKKDLWQIFGMIFIFCFSSFSVPVIAGGGRDTNFEMLIYEKIFIESNWAGATTLCLMQILIVLFLTYAIPREMYEHKPHFSRGRYLGSYFGLFLVFSYLILYLGGYFFGLLQSLRHIVFLSMYMTDLRLAVLYTYQSSFLYMTVMLVLLYLWCYDWLSSDLKWNSGQRLLSVSTLFVGFSIYLLFSSKREFDSLKLVLGTTILFFIPLFKIFLQTSFESLRSQLQTARIFGLSKNQIIVQIIWPQMQGAFVVWLVVAGLWFMTDYAVSRAVGLQTVTMGTLAESLLSSYRLPLAYLMTLFILLINTLFVVLVYCILQGLYVGYKKLKI